MKTKFMTAQLELTRLAIGYLAIGYQSQTQPLTSPGASISNFQFAIPPPPQAGLPTNAVTVING